MALLKPCSIVIPAYEEEQSIGEELARLRAVVDKAEMVTEVIVVDDGSRDHTGEIARSAGVTVVRHQRNRGYGAAIKTGIRRAQHDVIVITDADGTYPCRDIPRLVAMMDDFDMVVGARTGSDVRIPLLRKPAKWLLGKLANYVAGLDIPDLNSGLRAFRKDVAVQFFHMMPSGFSLTTTLTLAMLTSDYNTAFTPIDYHPRVGRSKINPIRDTMNFFVMVMRLALFFRPLRVFVPAGLVLMLLSVIKVLYDGATYSFSLRGSTIAILMVTFQTWVLGLVADLIVAQRRAG